MAGTKRYVVSGAVAVIPTKDGSERYMYRGAIVSEEGFTAEGIAHVLSVGLLSEIVEPEVVEVVEVEVVTEKNSVEEIGAFAADFSIHLGDAKTKAEKVAVINTAIEERAAVLEAGSL